MNIENFLLIFVLSVYLFNCFCIFFFFFFFPSFVVLVLGMDEIINLMTGLVPDYYEMCHET